MTPSLAGENSKHIAGLDGLRGIAILSVLLHHLLVYFNLGLLPLIKGGFLGVDLFFVLSGFLITWLGLQEIDHTGSLNLTKFYLRRGLRLLPALVVMVLTMTLVFVLSGTLKQDWPYIFSVLFYYQNWMIYFTIYTPKAFGHLWSLSIEEQFYIFWPIALIAAYRFVPLNRTSVLLGIIVIGVMIYRFLLWEESLNWFLLYIRTDLRLDAFLLGAVTAYIWSNANVNLPVPASLLRNFCALLFATLVLTSNVTEGFYFQFGAAATGICAALWIFSCRDQEGTRSSYLSWRWLKYFGTRSYGMYIWHFPIFLYVSKWSNGQLVYFSALAGLLLTLLVTEMSWRLVEKRFNALRKTIAQP